MSPQGVARGQGKRGFPRVSGDEPQCGRKGAGSSTFSPRERGCAVNRAVKAAQDGVFPA